MSMKKAVWYSCILCIAPICYAGKPQKSSFVLPFQLKAAMVQYKSMKNLQQQELALPPKPIDINTSERTPDGKTEVTLKYIPGDSYHLSIIDIQTKQAYVSDEIPQDASPIVFVTANNQIVLQRGVALNSWHLPVHETFKSLDNDQENLLEVMDSYHKKYGAVIFKKLAANPHTRLQYKRVFDTFTLPAQKILNTAYNITPLSEESGCVIN